MTNICIFYGWITRLEIEMKCQNGAGEAVARLTNLTMSISCGLDAGLGPEVTEE